MADLDIERFLKVAKLLDGGATDGERGAALARCNAMLKAAGKSWVDVVKLDGKIRGLSPSDVRTIADAHMVLATLRHAGLSLAQVHAIKGLQDRLEADRKAFQKEKDEWLQKQLRWQRQMAQGQEERLRKQHQEDVERARRHNAQDDHAATMEARARFTPKAAPDLRTWNLWKIKNRDRAAWIEDKKDSFDFAESLFNWVCNHGGLTLRQREAVDRMIERDEGL